ncbi:MAG: hypothetical protein A2Y81_12485 [Nitrospirae bacterium RBG_13_43_8]|jgi:excisionase family DNA binding protein|nr:MAG: hypothetical protein A2Y81_12485 [Nitrospirae bacterium RBG_13_43_8]
MSALLKESRNETDIKPGQRLCSIKQAAVILGRSPWTVAEMVRSGRLPYIPDGKRRFLDIHDLNDWIEKSKRRDLD